MKKIHKIDIRLFLVLFVCFFLSIFLVLGLQNSDVEYEELIYAKHLEGNEQLTLKEEVYVLTVPSLDEEDLTSSEKSNIEEQNFNKLQYLAENVFSTTKGVFILNTDLLAQASDERRCLNTFRKAGNTFWHYNNKNIGYYHEDDKCGQVKFVDEFYGEVDCFEVYGEGKYSKNFVPYFFMTMDGSKVEYKESSQKYIITEPSGKKRTLYALDDGTIRVRETSKYNVNYFDLNAFYQKVEKGNNLEDYKDAIFLIQDSKLNSSYADKVEGYQDLADYYIDVLGTIENDATIPYLKLTGRICFVLFGVLILGLAIIYMPFWACIITYLCEIGLAIIANIFLFQYDICYLPITDFVLGVSLTFLILGVFKNVLSKISVRNLPIDAVIRFTNTIINIDHSVSYSEYLMKNRGEIEEDISASLLLPVMDKESFLLKELAAENHRNKRFVENEFWNSNSVDSSVTQIRSNLFEGSKYIAFVPLPIFDVESEGAIYTVIGLKKKLKSQNASYISMMLFSMYIYFKAQHERGEHQKMYFSMLSLMISVIDAKDPVTAGHSQRVANISKDIGIWLELGKNEQFDLEFTALLHDIGKIGVSDYVLNKQSVYTQNDFEQMKYHTIRGAEMLSEVGISEDIIDGVRHHHERIDGKGYPDGIKGDELSLFAKIIKIADVFDALTSKRQYKEAWEVEKALNIIYRGRGTEFDSDIADVFIEHMSPPGWIPPVDEKTSGDRRNPNMDKAAKIVIDFYEKYKQYLSIEYPIPSRKAPEIDFASASGFMEYDWGETFNNAEFLEDKPMILAYEKNTKSLLFGQSSKGNGVNSIYYYFFKGFVNMGIYLLVPSAVKSILAKLADTFSEPYVIDDQMMIYETRKMRVVFYRTLDDKCLLFYISDYMCSNYVFRKQEK